MNGTHSEAIEIANSCGFAAAWLRLGCGYAYGCGYHSVGAVWLWFGCGWVQLRFWLWLRLRLR